MNTSCALCRTPLSLMDTVLGENKLSDGGILCNKCLNKATGINKDLVHGLINYSLAEIRDLVWGESMEEVEEIEEEPIVETSVSRTTITFSHTVKFSIDKPKPTRSEEIREQILALNTKLSASVNNDIEELTNVLDIDEKIIAISDAKYLHNNMNGLLIATKRRVIFINKNFFGSIYKKDFSHQNITIVLAGKGENSSMLKIMMNVGTADFILKQSNSAQFFCDAMEGYINSSANRQKQRLAHPEVESPLYTKPQQTPQQKEDPSTVFDKLEKLGRLRESGILTEEEFITQKKKLLDTL